MRSDPRFPNLHIVDHPLIQHKLSIMRQKETSTNVFRQLLHEITVLMGYELTRDLPLSTRTIETPISPMEAPTLAGKKQVIVPILRAGLGMSDGLLELMPSARVGHLGMYRDENKNPVEYLVRMPNVADRLIFICDPMLATGHSAVYAVNALVKRGVPPESMKFLALVAAPEGVQVMLEAYPMVEIWTASLDQCLNDHAYIVPGLGDAGDRLFGTKDMMT